VYKELQLTGENAGLTNSDSGSDILVDFQGDAPDNVGQGIVDEPPQSDDEEEDVSEEEDVADYENGWEPEREGAPADEDNTNETLDDNPNELDKRTDSDEEAGARHTAERVIVGDGHGIKPAVVVCYTDKHPSSAAGGALAHRESTDNNYHTKVSDQEKNPWAPFMSQKDWEVARWAKVRGPGATAFSELLSIPGVSLMMVYISLSRKKLTNQPF